jgi:hypothetical protein
MPKEVNIERCMGNENIYEVITFQNSIIPSMPLNIALVGSIGTTFKNCDCHHDGDYML